MLAAARALVGSEGGEVQAIVLGPAGVEAEQALRHGADSVRVFAHESLTLYQPDAHAEIVTRQAADAGREAVVLAATATGRDLAPRIAARLGAPLAGDVTAIERDGEGVRLTRAVYAGRAMQTLAARRSPLVVSVRPKQFAPIEAGDPGAAAVETVEWDGAVELRSRTVAARAESKAALDVSEATIVVSGGRGLREAEHFDLIEKLAAAFGNAAVGASRAVVDAGWRPHSEQVGQTGKTVSPQLYVAVGISGAIQHLAGMKTSKVIVAINKDPEAPIFKVADYGLVGDAFEVVPALTEEVKKVKAQG